MDAGESWFGRQPLAEYPGDISCCPSRRAQSVRGATCQRINPGFLMRPSLTRQRRRAAPPSVASLAFVSFGFLALPAASATEPEPSDTAAVVAPPDGYRMVANTPTPDDALGTRPDGVGLGVGATVPAFSATDEQGTLHAWESLHSGQAKLVVFYRGGWCPFCAHQLHELMQAEETFAEHGFSLMAISVDTMSEVARVNQAFSFPFPVLSDSTLDAHQAFEVTFRVPDDEVERLQGMGLDIEAASGQTHHTLAVPAVFFVDADGVVIWAHADLDYRTRPSVEQLLQVSAALHANEHRSTD